MSVGDISSGSNGFDVEIRNWLDSVQLDLLHSKAQLAALDELRTVMRTFDPDTDVGSFWPYTFLALSEAVGVRLWRVASDQGTDTVSIGRLLSNVRAHRDKFTRDELNLRRDRMGFGDDPIEEWDYVEIDHRLRRVRGLLHEIRPELELLDDWRQRVAHAIGSDVNGLKFVPPKMPIEALEKIIDHMCQVTNELSIGFDGASFDCQGEVAYIPQIRRDSRHAIRAWYENRANWALSEE